MRGIQVEDGITRSSAVAAAISMAGAIASKHNQRPRAASGRRIRNINAMALTVSVAVKMNLKRNL